MAAAATAVAASASPRVRWSSGRQQMAHRQHDWTQLLWQRGVQTCEEGDPPSKVHSPMVECERNEPHSAALHKLTDGEYKLPHEDPPPLSRPSGTPVRQVSNSATRNLRVNGGGTSVGDDAEEGEWIPPRLHELRQRSFEMMQALDLPQNSTHLSSGQSQQLAPPFRSGGFNFWHPNPPLPAPGGQGPGAPSPRVAITWDNKEAMRREGRGGARRRWKQGKFGQLPRGADFTISTNQGQPRNSGQPGRGPVTARPPGGFGKKPVGHAQSWEPQGTSLERGFGGKRAVTSDRGTWRGRGGGQLPLPPGAQREHRPGELTPTNGTRHKLYRHQDRQGSGVPSGPPGSVGSGKHRPKKRKRRHTKDDANRECRGLQRRKMVDDICSVEAQEDPLQKGGVDPEAGRATGDSAGGEAVALETPPPWLRSSPMPNPPWMATPGAPAGEGQLGDVMEGFQVNPYGSMNGCLRLDVVEQSGSSHSSAGESGRSYSQGSSSAQGGEDESAGTHSRGSSGSWGWSPDKQGQGEATGGQTHGESSGEKGGAKGLGHAAGLCGGEDAPAPADHTKNTKNSSQSRGASDGDTKKAEVSHIRPVPAASDEAMAGEGRSSSPSSSSSVGQESTRQTEWHAVLRDGIDDPPGGIKAGEEEREGGGSESLSKSEGSPQGTLTGQGPNGKGLGRVDDSPGERRSRQSKRRGRGSEQSEEVLPLQLGHRRQKYNLLLLSPQQKVGPAHGETARAGGVGESSGGWASADSFMRARIEEQDTQIARMEEENLTLKERLFVAEQELRELRRKVAGLHGWGSGAEQEQGMMLLMEEGADNSMAGPAARIQQDLYVQEESCAPGQGGGHGGGEEGKGEFYAMDNKEALGERGAGEEATSPPGSASY